MSISIACPECGKKLKVSEALLGKQVQCPGCTTIVPVALPTTGPDAVTALPNVLPAPAARRRRTRRDDEDDDNPYRREQGDDVVSSVIPYKNGMALAAYYCGVFGIIPGVGLVLGPLALVLGILGLRYVRANPRAKGTGHAITGIVLGSLATLGNWGCIGVGTLGMFRK